MKKKRRKSCSFPLICALAQIIIALWELNKDILKKDTYPRDSGDFKR
jgi:hypothetical protein